MHNESIPKSLSAHYSSTYVMNVVNELKDVSPGGGGLMPGGGGREMFMTAGELLGSRLK